MKNNFENQLKSCELLALITGNMVLALHVFNGEPIEEALKTVHYSERYREILDLDSDEWYATGYMNYVDICKENRLNPAEPFDSVVCEEMDEVDFALKVFEKTRVLLGDSGVILQRILDVNGFYPLLFEKYRKEPGTDPESVAQKLASEFEKKYYRQHPDWPRMFWFGNN